MKKVYILGAMVCGLAACKPNIEPTAPERGDADFTAYVAVGSSHTAGVMDGSLYLDGQRNSYPLMLSEQMKAVGSGEFKQPYVPGQHGWPMAKYVLDYVQGKCDSVSRIDRTLFKGALDTAGTGRNIFGAGPFNNMGIPHSKVTDYLVPGFGMQNRYAARMFKNPATSKPLNELQAPGHTFFTLWLGMDDVLDYAMAGGEADGTPDVRNTITNIGAFNAAYDSLLNAMTRNGAKGVALTLPDILDFPYFTTLSPRGLYLDIKDANKYNLVYNGTQVHFEVGYNYYVIEDKSTKEGFRQIKEGERVLMDLPKDSVICNGWGFKTPIPARYVITYDEMEKVLNMTADYNGTILKLANAYNIPVSEARYFFKGVIAEGANYHGAEFSTKFYEGGIFSLDGIHLTGKGNALLANSIIETINAHYKSTINSVDVNKYSGVKIP